MAKTNVLTEWLGIPPDEQPPHHYRLLGLRLFTTDRGRIDAAAEKTIDRVRKHAGEKHKAIAGKLIGMINAAHTCLLNADSKSAYDDKLRAAGGIVPTAGDALPEPMELDQIIKSDESGSTTGSRKKSSAILLSAVGGVAVALLVYVFAFSGWFGGEKEDEAKPGGDQLANNSEESTPQRNPSASQPTPSISGNQPNVATVSGGTLPPEEIAGEPTSTGNGTTKTNGSPVSTNTDTAPAGSPVVKTVNLLELIDPLKHTLEGEWKFSRGALENTQDRARIEVPFAPSEEYELHITATLSPQPAYDPGLQIGLVGGGQQFLVVLNQRDAEAAHRNGLYVLDRKKFSQNETYSLAETTKAGIPVQIFCKVLKTGVTVTVDGRRVIDWKGKFSRLAPSSRWTAVPNPKHLIIVTDSKYRITKLAYRSLDATKSNRLVINLLTRIDPQKHRVAGKWTLDGATLVNHGGVNSRLQIPFSPPEEYQLNITAQRISRAQRFSKNGLNDIVVGLVAGERPFAAIFEHRERYSGLYKLDGVLMLKENSSVFDGPLFNDGIPAEIICKVRKSGVSITVNGRTIVDWKGVFSRLTPLDPDYRVPNRTQLFIGGDSPFRFSKINLRPLGAAAGVPSIREPIPDIAAQQKADKLIRDLFKEDFANLKRVGDKLKLAGKLLEQAQTSDDDPAARYVLLQEAKKLALDAGDPTLTMDVVDSIVWYFDVDSTAERMAVLRKLAGSVRFPTNGKAVAVAAIDVAKSALEAEQFETALDFIKLAGSTASKFRLRQLNKEVGNFRTRVLTLKQWHEDATAASQTLTDNPDDPQANLVWGSYLCFIKQDWTAGLPLLAKSDNAGLKAVVKLEVAAPTDAKTMNAVADAWWNLAQTKKTDRFQKSHWLARAGHWYGKAVGELTGLQKTLVEKRLKEIAATVRP